MKAVTAILALTLASAALGKEYHVSIKGDDGHDGTAAARLAQPGDVITAHEGVYRERIHS
jgi:hypothetical protein